jgi:DNA-binding CsgD family transcriptional regulator
MKTKNCKNITLLGPERLSGLSALEFNEAIADKVDLICAPFLQNLGMAHFGYIKIFNNGKMFRMANNKEWTKRYFEKEFFNDKIFYNMQNVSKEKNRLRILTGQPQGEHLTSLCHDFGIWNALAIYEKFENYTEIWFFGANKYNTETINFYINKSDVLNMFILYFKDKASKELQNIKTRPLISTSINPQEEQHDEKARIDDFFDEINITTYDISEKLTISKKEFEILSFFVQGKTAKEIARLSGGSFRTVEFHLGNLKKKANCQKKSQLIDFLLKNSFFCSLLEKI